MTLSTQERKSLLVFGYGLALILSVIGIRIGFKQGLTFWPVLLLEAAAVLCALTLINVEWINPLYLRWMRVAHGIGTIVTGALLSIFFYVVFGTVGLILRLMRKDLLDQRWEPHKKSYWGQKPATAFDLKNYKRQF